MGLIGAVMAEGRYRAALRRAAAAAAPIVRRFLVAQYRAKGLKVRTGKLLGAISRATVEPNARGTALLLALPPGITPYKGQKNPGGFYAAAGALNYGSVVMVGGRKPRRMQARKLASLAFRREPRLQVLAATRKTRTVLTSAGIARVRKGKRYFVLPRAAKEIVARRVAQAMRRE